jgi:hypothetical protein
MRPADESWQVTMVESEGMVRLDFARGFDAPRSLTVMSDNNDDELHRVVCQFLWTYWPSDGRPS